MAEVLFAQALPGWRVSSAGLGALVGEGAAENSILAMGELGSSLANHVATQVDESRVREAELVLTMTSDQKDEVERLFPWARGRVFRIGHWLGFDVEDPYREPLEVFFSAHQKIQLAVESWVAKIAR
jgi:protein-tyrosine phosphatase